MPKKASSDLFDLIQSLTKSEKRYFKLYSSKNKGQSEKQYIKLFDTIDKSSFYDEEKIIYKVPEIKKFSVVKNQLYNLILKSLSAQNSEKSSILNERSRLNEIEILYSKGLYNQCKKQVNLAKKRATENEQFELLLQLLKIEKNQLIHAMSFDNLKQYQKSISKISEETSHVLRQIENLSQLTEILLPITRLYFEGAQFQTKEDLKYLSTVSSSEILASEKNAISNTAKLSYHLIWAICSSLNQEHEKAYDAIKSRLKIFEGYKIFKDEFFADYLHTLKLTTSFALKCENVQEAEKSLSILKNYFKSVENYDNETGKSIFINYILSNFETLKAERKYFEILGYKDIVFKYLNEYSQKIHPGIKFEIIYHLAYSDFCVGNYDSALSNIEIITNNKHIGVNTDIYKISQILHLITLLELNRNTELEKIAKTWQRSFDNSIIYHEMDREFFGLIRKINSCADTSIKKKIYDFRDYLMSRQFEFSHLKLYEFFAVFDWLESKLKDLNIYEYQKK